MFVSVVLDPAGTDSARALASILTRFNFQKIQRACWESNNVTENQLTILKREMDQATDYYDTLRIYQFPLNGHFAISELRQKKWKKSVYGAGNPAPSN